MGSLVTVIAVIAGIVILVQSIIIFSLWMRYAILVVATKPLSRGDD